MLRRRASYARRVAPPAVGSSQRNGRFFIPGSLDNIVT